ncbi:cupin domain-containing protein [Antarctobacter sp.]|uniref:cupin domain-containing protein n=1 Tax=Antarctobacter sp. TaxID=1872577 RepID=UPI002B273A55|nr:cupin domain-containing protein [Antarctobacter sp.]
MSKGPIVATAENVTRQVLSHHPELMVVAFCFEREGSNDALHDHPHARSTYVESGRYRFTLGEEEHELGPGDRLTIPPGTTRGCVCLEPGTFIDCFTP